ncbi:MAG: hypothetical protein ACFE0O_04560 [Opitutales bacterium]
MIELQQETTPFHWIGYLNASARGNRPERKTLPCYRATISGLPDNHPSLLAAADPQGRTALSDNPINLLGCLLPQELEPFFRQRP